jgi:hypothetical protein
LIFRDPESREEIVLNSEATTTPAFSGGQGQRDGGEREREREVFR